MELPIYERLAVIESVVLRLESRLFGNGQPGELQSLKDRVHRIETWFWRLAGGLCVLAFLIEIVSRLRR